MMDILEMVTYTNTADFGSPPKYDSPLGGIVNYIAQEVTKEAKTELVSLGCSGCQLIVDQIEMSQDFVTGSRHARVTVKYFSQEYAQKCIYEVEYNDVHDIQISKNEFPNKNSMIHFITAVFGREERLKRMIQLYQRIAKKGKVFGICMISYEGNEYDIEELLAVLPSNIPIHVIHMPGIFMKAPGLQKCIDLLKDDDIAFILDVDIEFNERLLENIQSFIIPSERFLAPIVYYENMDSIKLYEDSPVGYATMGTGILGAYVADIRRIGGYDTEKFRELHGWEDTDFFFRLRHSNMKVARFRDNRMVHIPHARTGTWSNSSTKMTSALFNCQNLTSYLDSVGFHPLKTSQESQMPAKVYFRLLSSHDGVKQGIIIKHVQDKVLIKLDNEEGKNVWIKQTQETLAYLDILHFIYQAQIFTNISPQERFWAEHILSHQADQKIFLSKEPVKVGDYLKVAFSPSLCNIFAITIQTGHPDYPEKILQSGLLTLLFHENNFTQEDSYEEDLEFFNGVASASGWRDGICLEEMSVLVRKDQKFRVIFRPLQIEKHGNI